MKWNKEENDRLKELSKIKTFKEISQILDRSYDAIRIQASKLGIKSIYNPAEETKKLENRKKISSTLQKISLKDWKKFTETGQRILRHRSEYQKLRKKILEEGYHKCNKCGDNKYLDVDHIKPTSVYPDLLFDLNNIQILCKSCHKAKTKEEWKKYRWNTKVKL